MKLSVDEATADRLFLYFFFRMPNTAERIHNLAISSGIPHINLDILKKFEIPLPPIQIQRKISSILSSYDDLIANNNRRIALLEKMAEEVYREWFVRLRFPGYERVSFHHGMPQEWERTSLENALVLQRGFDLPIQSRQGGCVPTFR